MAFLEAMTFVFGGVSTLRQNIQLEIFNEEKYGFLVWQAASTSIGRRVELLTPQQLEPERQDGVGDKGSLQSAPPLLSP